MKIQEFSSNGVCITSALIDEVACLEIAEELAAIQNKGVGIRHLLAFDWCQKLASEIRAHPEIKALLPSDAVAVQCTYFEKSTDQNWLVPVHQDLSIPVLEKVDHPALTGWSEKDDALFVQAPDDVLNELVAVRLHIDDCGVEDGPLKVVPGSHVYGRLDNEQALQLRDASGEKICTANKGCALIMKPLLLHASSKAMGNSKRRVLHFIFGPRDLPYGLKWKFSV